jgi:two-component system response regulator DctR
VSASHHGPSPWRVLVVEDDTMVASVHCRLISAVGGYEIVGVARSGAEGRHLLHSSRPDLVVLDFGLPLGNGLDLLRHIRLSTTNVEVIAVSAASTCDVIRFALHLGVVDYLVKPFEPDRLRKALAEFSRRMVLVAHEGSGQSVVDALRSPLGGRRWVPKDLSEGRLLAVLGVIRNSDVGLSATEISGRLSMARVTARRYLEHLVGTGAVSSTTTVGGRGRPAKLYARGPAIPVGDGDRSASGYLPGPPCAMPSEGTTGSSRRESCSPPV